MSPVLNFDEDLALANRLADAAWSAIRPHFRALSSIDNKAGAGQSYDPVTEADRAAEKAMREIIARERPQHGITGEEFGETPSSSGWRWVLDPVDGTRAFVAGLPVWTTLIALVDPLGFPRDRRDRPARPRRTLYRLAGWRGAADARPDAAPSPCPTSHPCPEAVISTTDPFILTASRNSRRLVRAARRQHGSRATDSMPMPMPGSPAAPCILWQRPAFSPGMSPP
jgi:hypothetical protein